MSYNETAYKASQKYKAGNIKRVPLDMQKSTYEEIKAHAEARSQSVNRFIKRAISENHGAGQRRCRTIKEVCHYGTVTTRTML